MRKVEATINIDCPSATVFSAFIEPLQLKKWWSVERCLIETKQGGIYSLTWNINNRGFNTSQLVSLQFINQQRNC